MLKSKSVPQFSGRAMVNSWLPDLMNEERKLSGGGAASPANELAQQNASLSPSTEDDDKSESEPLIVTTHHSHETLHRHHHAPFGELDIPDALLLYSLEFLSAKQVARIAVVNKKFQIVSEAKALWKKLKQRDFKAEHLNGEFLILHPKEEYAALFQGKLQVRDRKILTRRLRDCALLCRFFQQVICFIAPLPFFVSLILLLIQLTRSETEPLNPAIFTPAIICVLVSFIFLLWGSVLWIRGHCLPCFHWRLFGLMVIPNIPLPSISKCIVDTGNPGRLRSGMLVFLMIVFSFSAALILVLLKLTGAITTSHWITLLPAIGGSFLFLLFPLTTCKMFNQERDIHFVNKWITVFSVCFVVCLPPLITTELFFLRLDGIIQIHAGVALIPMFLQNLVILTATIIKYPFSTTSLFIITFAPWLVFEIFLAWRDWSSNPQIDLLSVFLPIMFGLGGATALGLFLVVFLTVHFVSARRIAQSRDLLNPIEQIPE
eukprot:TRINITY_DN35942_c0_g1_i2.p1 TRINITY_DN35942_c0_g1~~TRINITY_DN35942_c0_g1_i2.p1  ORF type:complete len:489 (-),score=94.78 TRINITY_DN35942_c0_g1_i2:45-1511(-)